jgi:putative phosphoesterase
MKILFFSDLHGSYKALKEIFKLWDKEQADYAVFLGDLLNHGPRNPLPEDYNPQKTAELFNNRCQHIISVRGNCDSEVDQMLINSPIMAPFSQILLENNYFFLTHGHLYTPEDAPKLPKNSIFVSGHTHLNLMEKREYLTFFNPGSVALPKNNQPAGYGIYENKKLKLKTLNGSLLNELDLS